MKNNDDTLTTDSAEIKQLINRVKQSELDQGDAQLIEKLLNFLLKRDVEDHIHLLVGLRATHRIADVLREIKACPAGREITIAEHACLKYSGRVGRSASAKSLDEAAVRLAVIAHIRHRETAYDKLLAKGYERREARAAVESAVSEVLDRWKTQR